MTRKWTTLAVAVAAVCLTASGFSFADEDSPLMKLMENVTKHNNAITKGVRTKVAYTKAQKELASHAEDLVKLAKQARDMKEAKEVVDKQKKTMAEWQKLMDDFIAKTESLKTAVAKSGTPQAEAKSLHGQVKASCTACHNVFRVEDDE